MSPNQASRLLPMLAFMLLFVAWIMYSPSPSTRGQAESDSGDWWSFTTVFGKVTPFNGSAHQSLSPTLTWEEAGDWAVGYEYCFDTSDNNECDGLWVAVGDGLSATLSDLSINTAYYW